MTRTGGALAIIASAVLAATPAPAWIGENLLQQPSFDEGINGWDNLAGKLWEQQDDAHPLNENPNPGSIEMLFITNDGVSQCVGVIGDQFYTVSVYVKTWLTGDANGQAGYSVHWYTDSFCQDSLEGPFIHPFGFYVGATDWKKMEGGALPPLQVHSALVSIGGFRTAGTGDSEMRSRFDDVVFAPVYNGTTTTTTTDEASTTTTDTVTTTTDEIGAPGCADPVLPYDETTVADALFVLRRSVGLVPCVSCQCDVDSSGSTTAGDALRTLRRAVGQAVTTHCGGCAD